MKTIIFGPLPPPFGGARVSFRFAADYLNQHSNEPYKICDVPVRKRKADGSLGGVSTLGTVIKLLGEIVKLPIRKRVILFCSRNFGFSFGMILILISRICLKQVHVRFFGGFPIDGLKETLPGILHKPALMLLSQTNIICQTRSGANQFPSHMQSRITVIPGYRPKQNVTPTKSPGGPFKFFYAGLINEDKGYDVLAKATAKLNNETDSFEVHLFGKADQSFVDSQKEELQFVYVRTEVYSFLSWLSNFWLTYLWLT